MKKCILITNILVYLSIIAIGQNVGIGTSSPAYKLDVAGTAHCSVNGYFDGAVGIGTTVPNYKLQVNGSIGMYNVSDAKAWVFNYSSGSNIFYVTEDGTPRMTLANGGNVGIGTTAPAAKLDVNGSTNIEGALTVVGAVTVNNKGILYNAANNSSLRYYTHTAAFTAILPAFGTSVEGSIGFSGFTTPPQVLVGDIVSTGGTAGQLYRVQLVVYDVTATGCHCRLINTSNGAVNYDITWNIICVGN